MSSENEHTVDKSNMTVSELFEHWIVFEKETDHSKISPKNAFLYYAAFLSAEFGKSRVNDISSESWIEFANGLSGSDGSVIGNLTADCSKKALKLFQKMFVYGNAEFGLNDPTFIPGSFGNKGLSDVEHDPAEYIFSSKITDLFI